jgi:co-chaperonin GroES (HSP10)
MIMDHETDPKIALLDSVGNLSNIEIFNTQVLVAVYIRPQKTKSGIFLTDKTTDEDRFQSKVGLILKKGESAFEEDGTWFKNIEFNDGDWVVFRPSDGWSITVNGVLCRILDDIHVKGRINTPDCVW